MTSEQIETIRAERTERAQRKADRRIAWAESREKKAETAGKIAESLGSVIPFGQPILVGHHSERGHRRLIERIQVASRNESEHFEMAEKHRQKANNILKYQTRVAGDAERARQIEREKLDQVISVGSRVTDFIFGSGVVVKVNRKTYTIKFDSGGTYAREKTYCRLAA